jgi:uncharacterized protein (TIGR03086 family)
MTTTLFETAITGADAVMQAVTEDHYAWPTPCDEWNVRDLANHMLNELAWVPELLAGKTIEQVGHALDGDLIEGTLARSWKAYAETARKAAESAPHEQVVHLSRGNVPATAYLEEIAGDIVIHTWDMAQAIGVPFHIDDEVARALYAIDQAKIPGWRQQGLIGPEVAVPADATAEVKLLGLFGRPAHYERKMK